MINLETVYTSPNDKSVCQTYILSNKLRVFVISDQTISIDAVALTVGVGHFQDPILGLAHFLEHMLFMGSTKYPDEKEFFKFITNNGGISNAYTASDHTCYYYTINSDKLFEALDIFGNFFISPLLKSDAVEREREAVNQEHEKNKFNDMWRHNDILRLVATDGSWYSKFGTGCSSTLGIPNIDEHVRDFFNKYYSAELMTLVMVSKHNISDIKQNINKIFSQITNKKYLKEEIYQQQKVLQAPKLIKVIPIEDKIKLILNWDCVSFNSTPKQSPSYIFSYLMGNECSDSLHQKLTDLGYITELSAGVRDTVYGRDIYYISMELTKEGEYHKSQIIDMVYSYLNMIVSNLSTPHMKKLYDDENKLVKFNFKYQENMSSLDRCLMTCNIFQKYICDPKEVFILSTLSDTYEIIAKNLFTILESMTPNNMVIISVSPQYTESPEIKTDIYYDTSYMITDYQHQIKDSPIKFKLIPPNPYISTKDKFISNINSQPLSYKSDGILLFIQQTIEFAVPNISIILKISLPHASMDKTSYVKTLLYFSSILDKSNTQIYMFKQASYMVNMYLSDTDKLYLSICGNYGKIYDILDFFISMILSKDISEKSFNNVKFILKSDAHNTKFLPPYRRLDGFFNKKYKTNYYDNYDILSVIDQITHLDVLDFSNTLLDDCMIVGLVAGNVCRKGITKIISCCKKFTHKNMQVKTHIHLPHTDMTHIIKSDNMLENGSAMNFYIWFDKIKYGKTKGWNIILCMINIIHNIISEEWFDKIRTKESFGYIVRGKHSSIMTEYKQYVFTIQSTKKNINQMIDRTKQFIDDFLISLESMSEQTFEQIKNGLINPLKAPFQNLYAKSQFVFDNEIETKYYNFNIIQQMIQTYHQITKNQLIKFYKKYFINRKSSIIGLVPNKVD